MSDTPVNMNVLTAQRGHIQALAFARKGGTILSGLLTRVADAKSVERQGPLETMLFLISNFSDDERHAIPVPGTKMEEAGNKPYDRYTTEVQTEGGKRKVPGSWFTDVVKNTDEWAHTNHLIECCNDSTTEGCPQYIKDMGTGERAAEKKRLRQRISDSRTVLVKGAMLFHHAEEISALNPKRIKVKMPFKAFKVLDDNGQPKMDENGAVTEIKVIGSVIRLQDPEGEIEDKVFSVSEFLALNPNKIPAGTKKEDITTTMLEDTKARAPRGSGKKGKGDDKIAKLPVAQTVEQFLTLCNVMTHSVDTESEEGKKVNTAIVAAVSAKTEHAKDVIETIGDAAMAIDHIWTMISGTYHQIKAAKAHAANAAAEAERLAKMQKTG